MNGKADTSHTLAVDIEDLAMRFPTNEGSVYTAVEDVKLSIPQGRFVSIVGPSGSGKSTILNAVAGLLKPAQGKVETLGRPVTKINDHTGYMFQQDALLPWKTVLDNVALGPRMAGEASEEDILKNAHAWIDRVGLRGFENAYPYQLSGGMRKRVAIAQTCITEPSILLMDEPFSALDVQTRQLMENELLELWGELSSAVLFVTHDLDEAVALSDQILLLSAGPGARIIGSYDVNISRPRDLLNIRTDPLFMEIYTLIWSDLRDEVIRANERNSAEALSW